jgi:hypothetical protein
MSSHVPKELEDISSAEEDAMKKKRQRSTQHLQPVDHLQSNNKRHKPTSTESDSLQKYMRNSIAMPALKPLNEQAVFTEPTQGQLKLKTMEELLAEHQYMSNDKEGKPVCDIGKGKCIGEPSVTNTIPIKSTATSKIRRSGRAEKHLNALRVFAKPPVEPVVTDTNPVYHSLFKSIFEHLFVPSFTRASAVGGILTQKEVDNKLHNKQLSLELMTFGLESELLKESGRWRHNGKTYDFPECANGDQCIVADPNSTFNRIVRTSTTGAAVTRTFKPCAIMTNNELFELFEHHKQPAQRRCCVACHRYWVCWYTLDTRAARFSDIEFIKQYDTTGTITLADQDNEPAPVFQLYRNLYDHPDGYYKEIVLLPKQGDCMIEPLCRLIAPLMTIKVVPDSGGRLMVDQSALQWKPHNDFNPRTGESLASF